MSYTVTVSGTTFDVSMSSVNFPVTLSQVGQQGVTGASWQGAWTLSADYAVNDVVSNGGSSYICILAHTAASTDEPGVGVNTATYWAILAQGGADGADGTGFTGGSYNVSTGVVTFTSDDGLGFSTGDLRGADGLSVNWRGDWVLSTAYALNDSVAHNGSSYICSQAHTSSATDEPGVGANTATYWGVLAEKGADGSGTGTVTSIDVAGGTGLTSSGGPVTSSGTITVALDAASQDSLALADSAQQPPAEGAFVNGDKTKLDGIEAGADVTDTANVTAAGALMDSEVTNLADVKAFDPADYATPDDVETATINAQTGTTYTLALTDRGQTVTMDNASANTVTIPTNASVAFAVGSVVTVLQKGAGVTTIAGATGVTVNGVSAGSGDMSAQWQGVALVKIGTDAWIVSGAIGTVA